MKRRSLFTLTGLGLLGTAGGIYGRNLFNV